MNWNQSELSEKDNELRKSITYYLLSIAAACLGFSIITTEKSILNKQLILVASAAILWLLSFISGIIYLTVLSKKYRKIINEITFFDMVGGGMDEVSWKEKLEDEVYKFNRQLNRFFFGQNMFLALGVILFIIWHVLNLKINTENQRLSNQTKVSVDASKRLLLTEKPLRN